MTLAAEPGGIRRRLGDLPLIWRFMVIPVAAVALMLLLGWSLLDLRRESIGQLETMRTEIQERLQTVVELGSSLAGTYSSISQLMIEAAETGEYAGLVERAQPALNDLEEIENALRDELSMVAAEPELEAQFDSLVEVVGNTRRASVTALETAALDPALAVQQSTNLTRRFAIANRRFLVAEHLLHARLNLRIADIADRIEVLTNRMLVELAVGFAVAISVKILSIVLLLRGVRRSIVQLSQITNASAGGVGDVDSRNEIALLNQAIDDAGRSHERLEAAGASLNESNEALQKREKTLRETNARLSESITELQRTIEQRDRAENALSRAQRIEAIGELTGGVAHDFNNLMAIILGNLELLKDEVDPMEHDRMVDAAIAATLRGADLTKNMLAFARRARLEPKVLDLNAIVLRTRSWAGRTLPANVEFETVLSENLWKVRADESSTESALLNLIVNARDAMPDGGHLTVETGNITIDDDHADGKSGDLEAGRYVMLAVSDTGTGIPEDVLEHVFDPFFTTKAPGSGSGLGLSMIEGFTRQSGGTVRVHSEEGVGTTFRLFFQAMEEEEQADVPAVPEKADRGLKPGKTVLVAEDESGVLDVLVANLSRAGFTVRAAASGDAALREFAKDPHIDVLVTDIVMPGRLQGPMLARELRKVRPGIPVIFMSGYASEGKVDEDSVREGDLRLMKPVRNVDLIRAIRKACGLEVDGA